MTGDEAAVLPWGEVFGVVATGAGVAGIVFLILCAVLVSVEVRRDQHTLTPWGRSGLVCAFLFMVCEACAIMAGLLSLILGAAGR